MLDIPNHQSISFLLVQQQRGKRSPKPQINYNNGALHKGNNYDQKCTGTGPCNYQQMTNKNIHNKYDNRQFQYQQQYQQQQQQYQQQQYQQQQQQQQQQYQQQQQQKQYQQQQYQQQQQFGWSENDLPILMLPKSIAIMNACV